MELVGVVRSPLASFRSYGLPHLGRDYTTNDIARMSDTFRISGCFPALEENLIDVIITPSDFSSILTRLGLTKTQLAATLSLPTDITTDTAGTRYPLLEDHLLAILHGRRRVAAGIQSTRIGWWPAKLFCVKGTWERFPTKIVFDVANDEDLVRRKAELFYHESTYSDGAIYRGVIEARRDGDKKRENDLRDRLTKPKNVSLRGLLKNDRLNTGFQKLLQFPGLLEGLQLGNVHKDLALHCDEQIEHYLNYVSATWSYITGGEPSIELATDADTVKNLQYRAPSSCVCDRKDISFLMENRTLWKRVTDLNDRRRLENNILSLRLIIPSVETLHDNMKYLRLGIKVLNNQFKQHTALELPRRVTSAKKTIPTLFESLERDWRAPATTPEGPDLRGIKDVTPYSAYAALVLAALRDFPYLQSESPRQERRGMKLPAKASLYHERQLAQLAASLGFDNPKIRKTLRSDIEEPMSKEPEEDEFQPGPGPPADWRSGRPFTKAYLAMQVDGFLPTLTLQPPDVLSPAFVLYDFMKAFFDLRQISQGSSEAEPITEAVSMEEVAENGACITSTDVAAAPFAYKRFGVFGNYSPLRAGGAQGAIPTQTMQTMPPRRGLLGNMLVSKLTPRGNEMTPGTGVKPGTTSGLRTLVGNGSFSFVQTPAPQINPYSSMVDGLKNSGSEDQTMPQRLGRRKASVAPIRAMRPPRPPRPPPSHREPQKRTKLQKANVGQAEVAYAGNKSQTGTPMTSQGPVTEAANASDISPQTDTTVTSQGPVYSANSDGFAETRPDYSIIDAEIPSPVQNSASHLIGRKRRWDVLEEGPDLVFRGERGRPLKKRRGQGSLQPLQLLLTQNMDLGEEQ